MPDIVEQLRAEGFVIVRGFLPADEMQRFSSEVDRIYQEGLKHHATYRDRNLLFEVLDDPRAARRVVLQAHWTPWISRRCRLASTTPYRPAWRECGSQGR